VKIAALVIEYRSPEKTAQCIASLLTENSCDFALVVDNSDDNGRTSAQLLSLVNNDPRVIVESSPRNLGFASAVNIGIRRLRRSSSAARALIINNDAVAEAGVVAALSDALEAEKRAVIAFPSLIHAGSPLAEVYYQRWTASLHSKAGWGRFRVPRGCCLMVDLDRWDYPLFDDRFFMYGEEIELGWRLRKEDSLLFVPGCLVHHEGSATSVRGSDFYEEHTAAAHWLLSELLIENRREAVFIAFSRAIALTMRGIMRSVRLRSFAPWRGVWRGRRRAREALSR